MNPGDRFETVCETRCMSGLPIPAGTVGTYIGDDIDGNVWVRFPHYPLRQLHRSEIRPAPSGLRQRRRARRTGTQVGLYDGIAAGMDTFSGRWQTVCEDHGAICSHRTLALARSAAPEPDSWCEDCRSSIA